jgi:hypothetical protein
MAGLQGAEDHAVAQPPQATPPPGLGVHLERQRRAPQASTFGQARDHTHDERHRPALAMPERARGLKTAWALCRVGAGA